MVGRFMSGPGGLVYVELEDKEPQRVPRRLIGEEKLDARLRHRRWRHHSEYLGYRVRLPLLAVQHDRDDETIVEGLQHIRRDPIRKHPRLHGLISSQEC